MGKTHNDKHIRQLSGSGAEMGTIKFDRQATKYQTMPAAIKKPDITIAKKGWKDLTRQSVKEVWKGLQESLKGLMIKKDRRPAKKSSQKVTKVRSEDVNDNQRPTPYSSNKPEDAEEDDTISEADQAWLESLELTDNPVQFEEPPDEFSKILTRFARDNQFDRLFWSSSPDKPNTVTIFADGMNPELQKALQKEMEGSLPSISVEMANSDCVFENLSSKVVEVNCNPCHDEVKWDNTGNTATCEVILQGSQPQKIKSSSLFCLTSAHLLLKKEEMLRAQDAKSGENLQLIIREIRAELLQRLHYHVYRLSFGDPQKEIDLSHLPMLAYRFYEDEKNSRPCMTDIVIIPIDPGYEEQLELARRRDQCRLTSIKPLTSAMLEKIAGRVKVFVKGQEGILVQPLHQISSEGHQQLGRHVSLVITQGEPLVGGDSGRVVYVKSGENRDAIAILKERRPKPQQHIYNAILLHPAIQEIQQDYPHLISDVQLYMPEKHLKLDQPLMSGTSEDDSQYTPEQPVFV